MRNLRETNTKERQTSPIYYFDDVELMLICS